MSEIMYAVTNPSTGEVEETFEVATDAQVEESIAAADKAFATWCISPFEQRAQLLEAVAAEHEARAEELSLTIVREMGKPIGQAKAEVALVADIYRYYAKVGPDLLKTQELETSLPGTAYQVNEGLGPLFGIMPWNFPLYQVARFAAPNIMNGNSILLKHAPQCPKTAAILQEIFDAAGAPAGLYTNVYVTNEQAATIIADDRILGVSFTGSDAAGRIVAQEAAESLTKVVLELGGNDAFLLVDTTDMDTVISEAVLSRTVNNGQACNASKRFVVLEEYYDEFLDKFIAAFEELKVGDPLDPSVNIGPLSSLAAANRLEQQVEAAVAEGAVVATGGVREDKHSAFFKPTILTGIEESMEVFDQELFGPVAMVIKAKDIDEAIAIANNSSFGLGAAVFSEDEAVALEVASKIRSGMVFINEAEGTAPELPFGGIKRSGFGRELGVLGMGEFVNRRMIRVNK